MLEEDEKLLRELAKTCKDAKEQNRYLALHAISIGHPVSLVAKIFCVDESAVYRWIDRWQEEKSMKDKPKEGRGQTLSEKDKKEIKNLIDEGDPKQHGLNASCWDTKELQIHFARRGIEVSQETIRRCLKDMGAHYVKAQLEYKEADAKEQKRFAKNFLAELSSKPDAVVILFQDEMSAGTSPRKGYGWTFEERLVIKAPQSQKLRLNCFGAVNPIEGRVIELSSKDAKSPAFIRFLTKIETQYPGKEIWLYCDNSRVHRSKRAAEFLERHQNIKIKYLPPYSPDLNPQEQWWNYLRKKLLNNRCFGTLHSLATSISWFDKLAEPAQVVSVCSLNHLQNLGR